MNVLQRLNILHTRNGRDVNLKITLPHIHAVVFIAIGFNHINSLFPSSFASLQMQLSTSTCSETPHPALITVQSTTMAGSISHEAPERIESRNLLRFEALPPELRSIIYSFALCHETQSDSANDYRSYPRLGTGPSVTALALSHVSRSVRADSMATYYGETTFLFIKWPSIPPLLPAILRWARSWGVHAAPHIRSLAITDKSLSPDCDQFRLDFNDSVRPLEYRPGDCPCLLKYLSVEDMNALVLAVLRPEERLEIDSQRLMMLFRAIRGGASGFASMDAVQRSFVIADLETKVAGDEKYWKLSRRL
jgi:hypothetical protein